MEVCELFEDDYTAVHKSDYAIVLGCAPEWAIKRAKIAAEFYLRGGCEKIVVSGGVEHEYKGSKVSESAIMRETLIEAGIPESAVLCEDRARDTIQNMVCSLDVICKNCDIFGVKNITVISEPYHMKRSLLLAKIFLPEFIAVYGYTKYAETYRMESEKEGDFRARALNEINLINYIRKHSNV